MKKKNVLETNLVLSGWKISKNVYVNTIENSVMTSNDRVSKEVSVITRLSMYLLQLYAQKNHIN